MTASEKHDDKSAARVGNVEKEKSSFVVDEEFEKMVRDLAPTHDDSTAPSLTFRVWLLGTLFCVVLGWINMLFTFRTNLFQVSSYVATLVSYPMGVFLAKTLPRWRVNFLGIDIDTNPGPFSVKEHVLIGIFGTTGAGGVYATYNLVVQEIYYDMHLNPVWCLAFLFASSALGFGISGMCRKFLIRPAHMIWPTVLPQVALYTAFHHVDTAAVKDDGKRHWSQLTMFGVGTAAMAAYQFFGPAYLMQMLQNLPLLCWLAPRSAKVAQQLGSPIYGVGMLAWTGDWSYIGSGSMSVPYWSAVNIFVCAIFFHWVVTPIIWQKNVFNAPPSPNALNTSRLFTSQSKVFKASDVIDKETHKMIDSEFLKRAPIHMSPFFAVSYWANFSTLPAALVHTITWYGKDIVARFRMSQQEEEEDIHCKLIDVYPEVPNTWYYGFFAATFILMLVTGQFSELAFPWWATIFATVLSAVSTIPIAVVLATAGVALYMNVISQFLIGLILPGEPIVMMAFKALGVSVSSQCLQLLADLKLGHYIKVPPRHVFIAQITAQFMAAFVCYASMRVYLSNPEHIQWVLDDGKKEGPGKVWGASQSHNVYYSASLIWGAVGPKRFFFDTQYSPVIWTGVIVGCITPIILKLAHTYIGGWIWPLIHPALILGPNGAGGNQGSTLSIFTVSTIFQFYMYRYRSGWWKRYNYVLATAFDCGTALIALLVFVLPDPPGWILSCPTGDCSEDILSVQGDYQDWCHPLTAE
ncbi:OPT oligopeptide transporter protein-domain-containing protein [Catenaria anguillulae PL171]|uniref:OPT oligopeptide transporter protein-domain-containing protein n=1 Tax=Catenaria anguillulae PL171 TaxID=765915 RepID=A0A1Y2H9W1_9FUNG|nr:OPT oligopeptide transporter protein-domain-containing protein [Catenaria anguillulae PL171]